MSPEPTIELYHLLIFVIRVICLSVLDVVYQEIYKITELGKLNLYAQH